MAICRRPRLLQPVLKTGLGSKKKGWHPVIKTRMFIKQYKILNEVISKKKSGQGELKIKIKAIIQYTFKLRTLLNPPPPQSDSLTIF